MRDPVYLHIYMEWQEEEGEQFGLIEEMVLNRMNAVQADFADMEKILGGGQRGISLLLRDAFNCCIKAQQAAGADLTQSNHLACSPRITFLRGF